jgi:prepilin-type N-terminal cleavage/methylation domain-containing protein
MKNKKSTKELVRGAQFCGFSLRSKTKLAKTKKLAGFTLLELLVVIGIIGIMSAVLLTSLSSTKSRTSLNAASAEVASAIKLAQSYALQGKMQMQSGVMAPVCGYGFRFTDATHYGIFFNPTNAVTGSCSLPAPQITNYDINISKQAESYALGNSVAFTGTPGAALVYFTVPNGKAYNVPNTIILQYGGSDNKTVTISSSGMVEEN